MMSKAEIVELCRSRSRIPEGLLIPKRIKTKIQLSEWLIGRGFNMQDAEYWHVFRLLRDEFSVALYESAPQPYDNENEVKERAKAKKKTLKSLIKKFE